MGGLRIPGWDPTLSLLRLWRPVVISLSIRRLALSLALAILVFMPSYAAGAPCDVFQLIVGEACTITDKEVESSLPQFDQGWLWRPTLPFPQFQPPPPPRVEFRVGDRTYQVGDKFQVGDRIFQVEPQTLPPIEYDHPYAGQLHVVELDPTLMRRICQRPEKSYFPVPPAGCAALDYPEPGHCTTFGNGSAFAVPIRTSMIVVMAASSRFIIYRGTATFPPRSVQGPITASS
jgi:hypothetical protein